MHDAATQLTNGEHQISSDLDRLQGIITNLVASGFVTDQASKAFDDSYQQFTSGAKNMMQGLDGMAQYLNKAASTMQETDSSLASAIRSH
jgi:WXG100 family type VII secretion target